MSGWQTTTLDSLVRFRNGKSIKPGGSGPFPVYGSNGTIGASDEYMYEDAIILGRVGAYCGSVERCSGKFWASDNTIVVEANDDEVSLSFLYYMLIDANLNRHAGGAAQPLLTQSRLKPLEFSVPTLATQRRIASILSTYDDLIENNTRRITILEEMARRLYEEWFVHFRFPGHQDVPCTETEHGLVPEGWGLKSLGEVCQRITDGAHKSPPTTTPGRPMASVKDMHEWGLHLGQCRTISDEDYDDLVRNSCKPERYDILIAKDGANLNKHTFLITEEMDVVLLSSIAIIRPGDTVHPEFLLAQLKSQEVSDRIKQSKSGAAIPRIVLKDFKRLAILVPPHAVQQRWVEAVTPLTTMCRTLVKKNTNLRAQRDLLLPKLISGQIDVSQGEQVLEKAVA